MIEKIKPKKENIDIALRSMVVTACAILLLVLGYFTAYYLFNIS